MDYLPELTIISALLNIGPLKLMHFNDLCLLFTNFSELYRSTYIYTYIDGVLWDVITLGSSIFKTIHPIFMKLTGIN